MHRTDPWYIAVVIIFALVLLTILLRRLRASLPGEQPQSSLDSRPNDYITSTTTEDRNHDIHRNDD